MLEWLKNILGDNWTEDIDKKISAEIGKGFVAKADFNAVNEAKKAAETQLADANKTIAGYKEMDIDAIRKSAADWQAKAEQAQKDADARVAAVQFDAKLDGAITKAKGRNGKAIKALVDELKAKGWVFAYIGANQDVEKAAATISITNVMCFEATADGTRDMSARVNKGRQRLYRRIADNDFLAEAANKNFFDEDV